MLRNIAKVLMSNLIGTVIGLVNSIVFPIILSIEGYAYYQQFILYVSYINICHLGIASGMFINYGGKAYEDTDKSRYKSEMHLIFSVLAFFTSIGLAIFLFSGKELILAVALSIFPVCLNASFRAIYQAWNKFTEYSITNVLPNAMVTITIVLIFLIMGNVNRGLIIIVYLVSQYLVCSYFLLEYGKFVRGAKSAKMLSSENMVTMKNGFLVTIGNYVNTLFHSIDKQFVNVLYSVHSFAMYSFAMSTQSMMTIFITALAQPFYPKMARGDMNKKELNFLKELLFMFGSLSGCAYFALSIVVKYFIKKYTGSLEVIGIFFAVFPAMAVINVIYINMYKIKRKLKKYVFVLLGMLGISIVFNGIAAVVHGGNIGISFATMCVYYVWLYYSQRDLEEITIGLKDTIYLVVYLGIYFSLTRVPNNIIGCVSYLVVIFIWDTVMYKSSVIELKDYVLEKIRTR